MTRGRKPKLQIHPELVDEIEQHLRAGNYTKTVCRLVGIHEATFYRWMAAGELAQMKLEVWADEHPDDAEPEECLTPKEREYREFRDRVRAGEAFAEVASVTHVRNAGLDDWRAAAWFLERKFWQRWGKAERIITDDAEVVTEDDFTNTILNDPDAAKLATALLRRVSEAGQGDASGTGDSGE